MQPAPFEHFILVSSHTAMNNLQNDPFVLKRKYEPKAKYSNKPGYVPDPTAD